MVTKDTPLAGSALRTDHSGLDIDSADAGGQCSSATAAANGLLDGHNWQLSVPDTIPDEMATGCPQIIR